MVDADYVPGRGDLVWLDFTPQAGRGHAGRRPALTLSPASYNRKVGLALFCPITSKVKNYSFEIPLPEGLPISGVVLSDQVRSLDWRSRTIEFIAAAPAHVVADTQARIEVLLKD